MPDTGSLRLAALRLLTRRDHSRAELQRKLATQAESPEALEQVLDTLLGEHLLSDERYARQRVASRATRYGNARLEQELRQHGVADSDIAAVLPDSDDEAARCLTVWQKKFGELPSTPAERAKQMRFLQYRGFSSAAIRHAMRGGDE